MAIDRYHSTIAGKILGLFFKVILASIAMMAAEAAN